MYKENRSLDKLSDQLRDRTLFNIGEAAKRIKKDLSVPSVDEAYAEIRLLDADEDEDDVMTLTYGYDRLNKICESLFERFRAFFRAFLESV